jgi:hypothetical protein
LFPGFRRLARAFRLLSEWRPFAGPTALPQGTFTRGERQAKRMVSRRRISPPSLRFVKLERSMAKAEGCRDMEFAGPASYRIYVQGTLNERWRDRLAGMAISTLHRPGEATRTMLMGRLRDQAELSGVLETLYSLHLPIVSVEKVD